MLRPDERQLIVLMLNRISDPIYVTKMIEKLTSRYEEEREELLKSLRVFDYSKDRIQIQLDPDVKMLAIIQNLESLTEKYYQDIEPLYRKREMYIRTAAFLDDLYYPVSDLMKGLYIKHSREKDIRTLLGLNIQEFYETHDEGIEAVAQFLKDNGYDPEGD